MAFWSDSERVPAGRRFSYREDIVVPPGGVLLVYDWCIHFVHGRWDAGSPEDRGLRRRKDVIRFYFARIDDAERFAESWRAILRSEATASRDGLEFDRAAPIPRRLRMGIASAYLRWITAGRGPARSAARSAAAGSGPISRA